MVEKVLSPVPGRSGVMTPKGLSMSNLFKSPSSVKRRNVFLDFTRLSQLVTQPAAPTATPKFNVKAMLLKRHLTDKQQNEEQKPNVSIDRPRVVGSPLPALGSGQGRKNIVLHLKKSFDITPAGNRIATKELFDNIFLKRTSPISRKDTPLALEKEHGTPILLQRRSVNPGSSTRSTNYSLINPRKETKEPPKRSFFVPSAVDRIFRKPVVSLAHLDDPDVATPGPKVQRTLNFIDLKNSSGRFGKPIKLN
jgi:hypothetical protein